MKMDKTDTQTFISRMPKTMHKQLRFISMYTGMTMQDIGNYAIEKEIALFKKQIPALQEMVEADQPKKEKSSTKPTEQTEIESESSKETDAEDQDDYK